MRAPTVERDFVTTEPQALLVRQPDGDDPRADHFAALFALANGLVGIKGSLDELAAEPDVVLPEVFVTRPITYHEAFPGYAVATDTRVLCPSPVRVRIVIDGVPIDLAVARIVAFDRGLDLATGVLHRTTRWQLADGRTFEIAAERLVPLDGGVQIASRLRFTPIDFAAHVVLVPCFGLGGEGTVGAADDPRISARLSQAWQAAGAVHPAPGESVSRFTGAGFALDYHSTVVPCGGVWRDDGHGGGVCATLSAGGTLGYHRVVAIATGAGEAPVAAAQPQGDYATLAAAQRCAVTTFRARAACAVAGHDALSLALAFNHFQLFQSASRDARFGTAAKGLTGDGYEGHSFWDAEAFMLPVLAFTAPDRARTLIDYRIGTLDKARANARQLGHASGALYPWRTIAGGECSSHYPTGAAQYHINADIAFALKLYTDVTGDAACLAEGAEMLFETARIWLQIGRFDPARGRDGEAAFCIYGVTGPDEYTALVDNDFYTNAAARLHLDFAAQTAAHLAASDPAAFAALAARIGLDQDEVAQWARAAAAMWLPVDPVRGVNPQDDTFLGKPAFPAPLRVPGRPLLLDHHPMALFRHQVCKQGNVVQAMAMGLVDLPRARADANYAWYEPITSHDSTLSPSAFGIVAARTGRSEAALAFLDELAFVDLENRHHNTDHGLHMAALAGSWLTLAQGWAGLAVRGGELHFRPVTAPGLSHYALTLQWRGSVIALAVTPEGTTYTLRQGAPVTLHDHGRAIALGTAPVTIARPGVRAVIFDLDGVLTDTAEDHYAAWAELARRHGLRFDRAFNDRLKGVDRAGSLRLILENSGLEMPEATFAAALAEKNALYQQRLTAYTPANLFAGVRDLFAACRAAGLGVALASASRNAPEVIARLGIADQFDFVADAATIARSKPAPDVFLACAAAMGVDPAACVGVEDAQAGVDAIRAAGMRAIGIDAADRLQGTAINLAHIADLTITTILATGERTTGAE